jgi:Niemann-Pick C1 protein
VNAQKRSVCRNAVSAETQCLCVQVFNIHDMVDSISVETYDGDEVTLQTICYKPFGQECAIESVAQYWQMDRRTYDSHSASLKYCLSHWSIACRSISLSLFLLHP